MKIHIRYIDNDPFYEVDCVPEIGRDTIQIIATDPYRFTADGWRVNVTQDEDAGLLAIAEAEIRGLTELRNAGTVEVRVHPFAPDFMRFRFYDIYNNKPMAVVLYGSVGEELARWEIK